MPDFSAPLSTVAPDLSGMSQPGSAAAGAMPQPNAPAPPPESMTPAMAPPDVTDRSINPAQAPPAPAGTGNAGGHTKLLQMIQGLSLGLASASTSIASHGERGGAAEVIQVQGEQARQQQEARAANQAQKDAELRNNLTVAETNRVNGANLLFNAKLPDEITQGHLTTQKLGQEVQTGRSVEDQRAQELINQGYQAPGYTADPQTGQAVRIGGQGASGQTPTAGAAPAAPGAAPAGTPNLLQGVTPTTAAPAVPGAPAAAPTGTPAVSGATPSVPRDGQYFLQRQAVVNEVIKVITAANGGKPTPLVTAAQKIIDDPNSTVYQINRATNLIQSAAGLSADTVKKLTEVAASQTAQTTAKYADQKSQADIALANARTEAAKTSTQKTASELKALQTGNSNLSGPEYLKSLPASRASNVQAFGEGRAQVNSRSFATPAGQALLSDITAAYPDYDQSKAITWDKTRNEYTGSGATAKKSVSYNTALEHMQDLYNNSTKEGLYLPGSKAYSDRSVALGYVSNEVGNAIKTGVMSKDEGENILSSLKGWTPSTAKERVAETARLLYDKIEEYQTKFADAAPSSAVKVPTLISPKAQSAYNFVQGINQAPAATAPTAPAGATGKAYPKGQTSGPQYWHDANGKNLGLVQ